MKSSTGLGTLLLAIWLILFGLLTNTIFQINFTHAGNVLAIFAIVIGVLMLLKR